MKRCADCLHFVARTAAELSESPMPVPRPDSSMGECHRKAPRPRVLRASQIGFFLAIQWPPVRPDDGCGEWAPLPVRPDYGEIQRLQALVDQLSTDNSNLQRMIEGMAERIAAQSELLTRRAMLPLEVLNGQAPSAAEQVSCPPG